MFPIFYISFENLYDYAIQWNNNSFKNINDIISEYNLNGYAVGLHGERCELIYDNFTQVSPIRCSILNNNDKHGVVPLGFDYISSVLANCITSSSDYLYSFGHHSFKYFTNIL
jgi:hypothetical protein